MKKIVSSVPNGGALWSNDILQSVINQEPWTAIESILQGIAPTAATGNVGVIVSGCAITGAGPYNCSAGIVYLNGQFMAFSGFSGQTLPQYIVPATLVTIPKTFADGVSRTMINQQDATYQSGVPGSGQYIALTTIGNQGSPGGQRYLGGGTAWNTLTLLNSWTNSSTPVARWRFTSAGNIELAGTIVVPAGLNITFANIPASWQSLTAWGNAAEFPLVSSRGGTRRTDFCLQVNNNLGTLNIISAGGTLTSGDLHILNHIFSIDTHSL
jgi:hypothetical protein